MNTQEILFPVELKAKMIDAVESAETTKQTEAPEVSCKNGVCLVNWKPQRPQA
ncbi:MAG TPA: hypothetical protein V6C69_19135 [Trichormus sp.]|jgi:hypothetical protein